MTGKLQLIVEKANELLGDPVGVVEIKHPLSGAIGIFDLGNCGHILVGHNADSFDVSVFEAGKSHADYAFDPIEFVYDNADSATSAVVAAVKQLRGSCA